MEIVPHGRRKTGSDAVLAAKAKSRATTLLVTHKEESLLFVMLTTDGPKLAIDGDRPELYGYALDYLRSKDLEDKFFSLYKEAYNAKLTLMDKESNKIETLTYLIGKALEDLAIDDIKEFIWKHKDVSKFVPPNIKEKVNSTNVNDGMVTADQTYTKEEYMGLIAIVIQQQLLLPIFADYLTSKGSASNALDKPTILTIMSILENLGYVDNNPSSVGRLLRYITAHLNRQSGGNIDKIINIATFYRVTDEELPKFILSFILFRKFPIQPPVYKIGKVSIKDLATEAYGVVRNVMIENALKTPNKINPIDSFNGEGKESLFESNSITTDISQSDEALILVSLSADTDADMRNLLAILFREYGLTPTREEYAMLLEHRKGIDGYYITENNLWLLTIFSNVFLPSKYLDILEPEHIYNLTSVIYVLVYKLIGEEASKLYKMEFRCGENIISIGSGAKPDKTEMQEVFKYYPVNMVYDKGESTPVIYTWLHTLIDRITECGRINIITRREIGVKDLKGVLVEMLIVAVKNKITHATSVAK